MSNLRVAYRHGVLALAGGSMLLILCGAIRAVTAGAPIADLAPIGVFLLVFGFFFGVFYLRRTRAIQARAVVKKLARAAEARREAAAPPRIVGATCAGCARRIAIESDGRHCATCGEPVHRKCVAPHSTEAHPVAAYR